MVKKTPEEARQGTKGWPVMAVLIVSLALVLGLVIASLIVG